MRFPEIAGRRYAQFERLAALPGLTHAFAVRPLDVSPRPSPDIAARDARRVQMVRDFNLDPDRLHYCIQVHTPQIARVGPNDPAGARDGLDGLLTNAPGISLMTFSADCPLILLYDPVRRALGMVHSSWRCTVAWSTRLLVERMQTDFDCNPRDIHAGVGPSAGPDRYEVQDDVLQAARAALPNADAHFRRRDGKLYFDMWSANTAQLAAAGVPADQIEVSGVCTMTRTDLFYSFRKEGHGCGHFGLLAALT